MPASPCARDCPDRSPTCHATCPRYAEYRAARDRVLAARERERDVRSYIIDTERAMKERGKPRRK